MIDINTVDIQTLGHKCLKNNLSVMKGKIIGLLILASRLVALVDSMFGFLNCVLSCYISRSGMNFSFKRWNLFFFYSQRSRPSMYPRLATYLNFVNLSEVSGVEFQSILNHSPGFVVHLNSKDHCDFFIGMFFSFFQVSVFESSWKQWQGRRKKTLVETMNSNLTYAL